MPTEPRTRYFHAASSARPVRYRLISSTEKIVVASMATHITPRLLIIGTAAIVAMKARKKA